jgi:hypothetical protein
LALAAGQLLYFGSDAVLATGAFRDPGLAYRFIFFMLSISTAFIYYWRIAHHMEAIRGMQTDGAKPGAIAIQPVEGSPGRGDAV